LENCAITSESPEGFGFGQAALELSTFFRVKPDDPEGKSIAGALVNVPISLQLPESSGPARIPPPPPAPWQLPPGARISILTNPSLVTAPTARQFAAAYPPAARATSVSGRAVMQCDVSIKGLLRNCVVVEETPAGFGFGQAALGLAPKFRMNPMTIDGKPTDTGHIRIPLEFKVAS